MAQLPNMSMLRLHPCGVATGAPKKRKPPTPPAKPPGQPKKKAKDAQYYRDAVENFFIERRLTSAARKRELLAIIEEDFPQHTFPDGDWIDSELPQSLIATIADGETQAGQWKWKLEQLLMAIDEFHQRETAKKKKKGAPDSSAPTSAKKKKSEQRAKEDAENAKKPQAVMGRDELTDNQRDELQKKFPDADQSAAPKVLGARKAPGCCMKRK